MNTEFLDKQMALLGQAFGWDNILKQIPFEYYMKHCAKIIHEFQQAEIDYASVHPECYKNEDVHWGAMSQIHAMSYAIDNPQYMKEYIQKNLKKRESP